MPVALIDHPMDPTRYPHNPLPPGSGALNDTGDGTVPQLPVHIVIHASQLPPEFLNPSLEKKFIIGFDCEGEDLCRHGKLCIMQLAFPDAVYLVDAIEGGAILMQACKPALESSFITKVVHDCKRDSEALCFQHGIKLHNVMDTQVSIDCIFSFRGAGRKEAVP